MAIVTSELQLVPELLFITWFKHGRIIVTRSLHEVEYKLWTTAYLISTWPLIISDWLNRFKFIMIVFIYTIGLGTSFYNFLIPLHSPCKYINNMNKLNQMTVDVQIISIIINKLSKSWRPREKQLPSGWQYTITAFIWGEHRKFIGLSHSFIIFV